MRSCPRDLHIKILREMECSDGGYTPLLYRTWFIVTLLIILLVCSIA